MRYTLVAIALVGITSISRANEPIGFAKEKTFTNGVGQKMIWVPAGSFRMGDLTGEGRDDEQPVRTVELSGYHLAATEVTQAQWKLVMGSNPSFFKPPFYKDDGNPVEQVGWEDAMDYCRKLTKRERLAGRLPAGYVYILPTEAQWEKACRAGTEGDYAGELDAMAWHDNNADNKTYPVATKKPNEWGFYDMHGNVWEWCLDWHSKKYDASDLRDPRGPADGSEKVVRGGSWFVEPWVCRSACRTPRITPNYRSSNMGFRPALSLANMGRVE